MKIKELNLQCFKRFTDLTITDIPQDCRLVLLIGANGSGKSSVFDAMNLVERGLISTNALDDYYKKTPMLAAKLNIQEDFSTATDLSEYAKALELSMSMETKVTIKFHENHESIMIEDEIKTGHAGVWKKFYGRPSLRIVTESKLNDYSAEKIKENKDRAVNFTGIEERFLNDLNEYIQDFIEAVTTPVFENRVVDTAQLRENFIQPLNNSLRRIFDNDPETSIQLSNLSGRTNKKPPQLFFKKGKSTIPYDYLSHGEKQVIILLLNFMVRRKYYDDAIWFIDEMDVHLNTALQYNLLREISENWLPVNAQLWTASHSLGFIDYARDYSQAILLDFDNLDFDLPQLLKPAPKNFTIYDISIPREMMDKLYDQGKRIVVCENKNDELLNKLKGFNDFYFSGVADSNSVFARIKGDERIWGMRDRDFLTTNEIRQLKAKYPNYKILDFYCFENYLYHPDNIAELKLTGFNREDYLNDILKQKKNIQNIIIPNLGSSRKGYEEFKMDAIKKDTDLTEIIEALQSDDFNCYYPFFNMKDYKKNYIGQFNVNIQILANTHWVKTEFEKIIK